MTLNTDGINLENYSGSERMKCRDGGMARKSEHSLGDIQSAPGRTTGARRAVAGCDCVVSGCLLTAEQVISGTACQGEEEGGGKEERKKKKKKLRATD